MLDRQLTRSVRRDIEVPTITHIEKVAAHLVGPDSELGRRKVFARRDVIVALAPHLYGHKPARLEREVDKIMAGRDVVPLLQQGAAREQMYALGWVLALEQAIADTVEKGLSTPGPAVVARRVADEAMARSEERLGRSLTYGQAAMVEGITTSGRSVELVLGVAGSGKTTALAAVRDAYEQGGFTVWGTSTSGQAARTLGREAGLLESRTIASLRWQLDNRRLHLSPQHVLIVDEAGMATDRDLYLLLAQGQRAGAKVIVVGDDRQLGPVGNGGALGALIKRHPHAVHRLAENLRQHDRAEVIALDQLRAGDVGLAVGWYARNDRIQTAPTKAEVLDRMIDAWKADHATGADTAMYAWRRDHVAALNQRARTALQHDGLLAGPELTHPDGRSYATGDRIIALAPNHDAGLVTSERGTVTRVTPALLEVELRMDDGRTVIVGGEQLAPDRLDHAYATTIHRAQGATVDHAHVLHDGANRELAYVATSRARQHTTIHTVADSLDQAADDLTRDWNRESRPTWAIDHHHLDLDQHRKLERDSRGIEPLDRAEPLERRIELPPFFERSRPAPEIELPYRSVEMDIPFW